MIGNAIKIARIATGEEEDTLAPTPEEEGKDPAAVAMGKKGGAARAKAMIKRCTGTNAIIFSSANGSRLAKA